MKKIIDYKKIYTEDYFNGKNSFFYQMGYGKLNANYFYNNLYRPLAPYVKKKKTGRVLDMGCAYGFVLQRFPKSFDRYGLDISKFAVEEARRRSPDISFRVGNAEGKQPFQDNYFDFIVMNDVLEHLNNPQKALQNAYSMLKKGGILYLNTPNLNLIRRTLYYYPDLKEHHVSLFPFGKLRKIINEAKFTILDSWTFVLGPPYKMPWVMGTDSIFICKKG